MNRAHMEELLLQALETELGGQQVYATALQAVKNTDLRAEWKKYLDETRTHAQIVRELCLNLGMNPDAETPGRHIVRANAQALVGMIELAIKTAAPRDAEIVAAEAVAHGELKDHQNWELIGKLAAELDEPEKSLVKAAYEKVDDEEDEHFYHTKGWARELWAQALGIPAVIPPPEEKLGVKSPLGEAMAAIGRKLM